MSTHVCHCGATFTNRRKMLAHRRQCVPASPDAAELRATAQEARARRDRQAEVAIGLARRESSTAAEEIRAAADRCPIHGLTPWHVWPCEKCHEEEVAQRRCPIHGGERDGAYACLRCRENQEKNDSFFVKNPPTWLLDDPLYGRAKTFCSASDPAIPRLCKDGKWRRPVR